MTLLKRMLDEFFHPQKRVLRLHEEQREADRNHPERLALLPYCQTGKGIDVGCGHRKTHENCIGVDIVAGGAIGSFGCEAGHASSADFCLSGDNLTVFADGELDFVISRHNLEHYIDIHKTLLEWKRVLKKGGIMAMVLPDERFINTIALDPTHKHVFTPETIQRYVDAVGGFTTILQDIVVPKWSFLSVFKKNQ